MIRQSDDGEKSADGAEFNPVIQLHRKSPFSREYGSIRLQQG
jgi:hypothetical protein